MINWDERLQRFLIHFWRLFGFMHPNSAACHWRHQDRRTHAVSPLCPQIGLVWACSHHPEKARAAAPLNLLYSSYHLAVSVESARHAWHFLENHHQPNPSTSTENIGNNHLHAFYLSVDAELNPKWYLLCFFLAFIYVIKTLNVM